jgi:predicted esterase
LGSFYFFSGALPGLVKKGDRIFVEGIDDVAAIDLHFTPVIVGCGDLDPLCPSEWADSTPEVFEKARANVDKRIYSGMGHLVFEDEREAIKLLLAQAEMEK